MGAMDAPTPLRDGTLGSWVNERLMRFGPRGVPVGSVVPTGFARVVRVLHPVGNGRTWAQAAREEGKVVHPLVQWGSIASHFDGSGRSSDVDPDDGCVPAATLEAILEHCPSEGDVTYGVWDGYGSWTDRDDGQSVLTPGWNGRSYRLFTARKAAFMQWPGMDPFWPQSANLIWPSDHSWCVATEIDWDSTLVACSDDVADGLLADSRLEAFEVAYEDDLSWYGDTVNPRPGWLR